MTVFILSRNLLFYYPNFLPLFQHHLLTLLHIARYFAIGFLLLFAFDLTLHQLFFYISFIQLSVFFRLPYRHNTPPLCFINFYKLLYSALIDFTNITYLVKLSYALNFSLKKQLPILLDSCFFDLTLQETLEELQCSLFLRIGK